MDGLDLERTHALLNEIIEYELAGVVRYTHYSLMVRGPTRIPLSPSSTPRPPNPGIMRSKPLKF